MAEEGSGTGTSVGAISVDVEANLSQFDSAMEKFDKSVTAASGKQIKLQLNLAKDFTAKEKMVEVTAKWAAGTLTGLAEKLAARNYAVTITKLKVSQDAYSTLRQSLDSLFANYTGIVNVTAKISGIDASTGNSINLNQNLLNQSDLATADSAPTTKPSTGQARGARPEPQTTSTSPSTSSTRTRRSKAEIAAAKQEAAQRAAALDELETILDREEARKAKKSADFAAKPRYSTPLINEARRLTSVQTAGYQPEWLRVMNARDRPPVPGGPVPGDVETAMRARITELTTRRTRTKNMEAELKALQDFVEPYQTGQVTNPQELHAYRMQQEGGPGSVWRNADAGSLPHGGGRTNRMPTTEAQLPVRIVGRVGKSQMTAWGYQKNRQALLALRSIDPDFKPRAGEDYYAAMTRARKNAEQPATMGEGVEWKGEIGDLYQNIAGTEGHVAARKFAVDAKNAIRSRYSAKTFRRKDRIATSLLNDVKTGRMTDEEREALGAVVVNDQDTADLLTLNQLIGGESGAHSGQARSGMVPKRSGQSVRGMGFETEAAVQAQDAREKAIARIRAKAEAEGRTPSEARLKSAGTRAANRTLTRLGYPKGLFDPKSGALTGFQGGAMEPLPSPDLQPGFEMSQMGWAQTPDSQNAMFDRGMHKSKTGRWMWNRTGDSRARRAKAEEVAEYQRLVAEGAAFSHGRENDIRSGATTPSAIPRTSDVSPSSTPYEQSESAQWRLTPTGRPQRLVNGRWQFGSTSTYNSWASTNGAPTAGTRTVEPTQIPLAAEPQPERILSRAAENIEPISGAASGGGGGGGGTVSISGPIDVNVLNFQDLASMLRSTSIGEGRQSLEGTPEEVAKALGFASMDDFRAALSGNGPVPETGAEGEGKKGNRGNRGTSVNRGGIRFPATDFAIDEAGNSLSSEFALTPAEKAKRARERAKGVASYNKAFVEPRRPMDDIEKADYQVTAERLFARADRRDGILTPTQEEAARVKADKPFAKASAAAQKNEAKELKAQRQYERYLDRQAEVHTKEAERQTKEDDRNERTYKAAGGPAQAGGFSLSEYTRARNLPTPAVRQRAARVNRDPAELAMERAQAASTRAEFPERAPSIAVGQLFSRAIGFKTRYQQAQEELTLRRSNLENSQKELARELESRDVMKEKVAGVSAYLKERAKEGPLSDADKAARKETIKLWQTQQRNVAAATFEVEKQTKGVEEQTKKVTASAGAFEKIASIGALFVGAKAFTIGLSAVSMGLGLVEKAGAKAVDQMMGFGATSTRVTGQLAEQTKAMHGNTEAVFGAAAMSAGLSEEAQKFVKNSTISTAQAKSGGLAQGETSELFRAAVGAGASPKGLYGGYGGLFNGSFLGSEMGGGKGYTEQLFGDLQAFKGMQDVAANGTSTYVAARGTKQHRIETGHSEATPEQLATGVAAGKANVQLIKDQNTAYERNYKYLGKASDGLKLVADESKPAAEAMKALSDIMPEGEMKDAALAMVKSGVAIKDASGEFITTADQFNKYWQNAAGGKSRPEVSAVYEQQGWQTRAQLQSQQASYRYQMDNKIPGNWGLQLGINPMAQVTGAGTPLSAMAKGTSAGARSTAMGIAGQAQSGRDAIQAQADAYLQSMVDTAKFQLTSGGNATGAADLEANLTNVLNLGMQIRDVTKAISFIGAAQQAKEYANSLRLAQRAKEDALGLAGRGGSELGGIQRKQFMLGRESTALSLAMSQRQINYQVAVAGFQAPGGTSEARAANIKEAKLEAAYAQKQLDIQKKQFALGGREFGITAARAVTDAMASIGLLQGGRDASLQIAAYTAKLENLQAEQQLGVAKLQEGLNAADNIFQTKLGMAATAAGTLGVSLDDATAALNKWMESNGYGPQTKPEPGVTGGAGGSHVGGHNGREVGTARSSVVAAANAAVKATSKQLAEVNKHQAGAARAMAGATASNAKSISTYVNTIIAYWTKLFAAIQASSDAYSAAPSGGGSGAGGSHVGGHNGRESGITGATGLLGSTTGPTQMTVGEAGNETVAVLRNPRSVSASGIGGGGGTSIVIQINNPSVRNDGDITAIAREVEKVLNRKASLIGMRSI